MARNLINKYVWLVETIYRSRRITFEEINLRWLDNEMSEGLDLPLRTFHKWRIAVEEMFGLVIECERKGGYHYYIANAEELKEGNIRNWLLGTISVSNLLVDNQHLKDRILLEEIPSGQIYLAQIIEAMKNSNVINMTYHSYWRDKSNNFDVEPYCVKLFRQRWYLVGRSTYKGDIRIYALDRVECMTTLTDKRFQMPETFDPEAYFARSYGVIVEDGRIGESIRLKVVSTQANYLRSLPLHHTQRETYCDESYSIFEYHILPTQDIMREILWHGDTIEVLAPASLRTAIATQISHLHNIYNTNK